MAFDSFANRLKESIKKLLNSAGSEKVEETLEEIKRAFLEGDVDKEITDKFLQKVRDDIKSNKGKGLITKERVVDVIYNNLTEILGSGQEKLQISSIPFKILLVGLFGSGKTTTAAKLANYFKKRGYRVLLLGIDTSRPAAFDQLVQLGKQINVKVAGGGKDAVKSIKDAEKSFKDFDVVIADSAGRDALDDELVKEIKLVKETLKPEEVMLVIPADIGQNAKMQVEAFHSTLNINHIILTKTDGTAAGGGALTAAYTSNAKVIFIGTGEKINEFEEFDPKSFASKLLGLEGLEGILKKAQEENIKVNEESAKNILKGEFSLLDMYEEYSSTKKMGPLDKLAEMIPGLPSSGRSKELIERQGENIGKFINIMDSMTKAELENPKTIDANRIKRIAKGSGQSEELVREILTQYNKTKQIMKMSKNRQVSSLMKRFGINL
ncbi:signal recognition particle receptor subunit alpha [Candidatus Parvarchaeota archaeon]|nr:signal recognition particle receptor subunit alpha [Candidatus Acidifodinimicrobium mancum]